VLRASRRVLRSGGRTAFLTIHPAPDLDAAQLRQAHRGGPVAVACATPSVELLRRAGFVDIVELDRTAEFAATGEAYLAEFERHRDAVVTLLGAPEFEQRQRERRVQLQAVRDGLLRRSLLTAVRP
jgi:hypothetical protein